MWSPPAADFAALTPPPFHFSHQTSRIFHALVHHRHGRRSRLVRGWIPREPREPLLGRLVRNPRGRRRGELALLRAALRGEPPHLRRGDAQGERSGQGAKTRRAIAPRCRPKAAPCSRLRRRGPRRAATARRAARLVGVRVTVRVRVRVTLTLTLTLTLSAESCSPGGSARISPAASMPGEG